MTLLIGLDLGTTTIKAVVYDVEKGKVVDTASRPTPVSHPQPEWSQHDPEALWQSATACLKEASAGRMISGLGVSSFAEAGVPLDENNNPLYPMISWYDRRCKPQADWWEAQLSTTELHAITGQRVSTSFGVNKWMWIRENEPGLAGHMTKWLSAPDYILWRLSGEQATDRTIASRTMLFDQRSLDWSAAMLEHAGMKRDNLPPVISSGTQIGKVTREASKAAGLPEGLPCVLGGHDHLCASFAAGAYHLGAVVDSAGTAEALVMVLPAFYTGKQFAEQSYACYAHVIPGQYILKGGLKAAGGAIEWLARQLAGPGAEELPWEELEAGASQGAGSKAGPLWLPHLLGGGSPESDALSRGALVGVKLEHERGDLFRGMLEALAFWLRQNLVEMESLSGQKTGKISLLGGTTRLQLFNQLKADVLGMPVALPELPEAAATGAALLAGLGTGAFTEPEDAVRSLRYESRTIEPDPQRVNWYDRLYEDVYRPLYRALQETHHKLSTFSTEGCV